MIIKYPGMIDVHTHLRVPGEEYKEDFSSASKAALAGGITTLLAMPNTNPPIIHLVELQKVKKLAHKKAFCDIFFFIGVTSETINQLPEISRQAVGLKIYMGHTYGPLLIQDTSLLAKCFDAFPRNKPIAVHAEGESIAIAIGLAQQYHRSVHICHVSRKEEIQTIQKAKEEGIAVTCEVTPHHLFLSERDLPRLGGLGIMKPSLAREEDVSILWQHINSTIDCIASDHAPHTLLEKKSKNPPAGVPGLETMFPLMHTAMVEGRLTQQRLLELLVENPLKIYKIPKQEETWVEVDPNEKWELKNEDLYTKCGWTPFSGKKVQGRVKKVCFKGKIVYQDGAFFL
jgi:dihydroorotase (multifunctional complex type)